MTFTIVTQAAMDGGETVKRLLVFARAPGDDAAQKVDLTELAREVAQLTAPHWRDAAQGEGRPIELVLETRGHPRIEGSYGRLREALTNLLLNAVDALPHGGTIKLRVCEEAGQAVVEVVDNGVGMSPSVQARIFEPFFTTKGDKGTGLGLATVFGVVEHMGGHVQVHSAVGDGTTFHLAFPVATSEPEPAARTTARPKFQPDSGAQRQLRILAVDDEPAITRAVVRLLRPSGHFVTTAESGEQALELLAREPFDLVVSDLGMGVGMNGWELAERVARNWSDVRFVLATGWGAAIDATAARSKGITAVLAKPYRPEELREVLAA